MQRIHKDYLFEIYFYSIKKLTSGAIQNTASPEAKVLTSLGLDTKLVH